MSYFAAHPFTSVIVGFGLVAFVLAWLVIDLRKKWQRVFGRRPSGTNELSGEVLERLVKLERALGGLEPRVNVLEGIGKISVQKVGFMRFNPFERTGSDQSFAVALLDREDNGLVLSSLYTREGVRVYAKEIQGGSSKHPLSEEEQKVLRQAMKSDS